MGEAEAKFGLVVAVLSVICGVVRFALADVEEVRVSAGGAITTANDLRILEGAVEQFELERKSKKRLTFEELQSGLSDYIKGGVLNIYSRKPLLQEATPGNVTLEAKTNGIDVVWYDIYGAGHVLGNFLGME